MYIQKLIEEMLPSFQNIVRICKMFIIPIFQEVTSRLVRLLRFIYDPI